MLEQRRFTNLQIELLKLYATDLGEEELRAVRKLLGEHFAVKASDAMDDVWSEKQLTPQDMTNWTNEHTRRPNRH
jgi:hypothetical protein